MKKINITISEEVYAAGENLACMLDVSRCELLRFCLEGLTNPSVARGGKGAFLLSKGLINPSVARGGKGAFLSSKGLTNPRKRPRM